MNRSYSESYKASGVDITAGYRAVDLMKEHVQRTRTTSSLDDIGGFGGCVSISGEDGDVPAAQGAAREMQAVRPPAALPGLHRMRQECA